MPSLLKSRALWVVVVVFLVAAFLVSRINPVGLMNAQVTRNDATLEEQLAYHIGTLAYIYGYPLVDMAKQMHNETHLVEQGQRVYAPVNRFYRFDDIVGPHNTGNFRMPNNDTLYFSAWFDISREPLLVTTPDTQDRYFTIAVTNLYSEVIHVGRRTHGTEAAVYALTLPNWQGQLPEGSTRIDVETPRGWLLGRVLVDGPEDFGAASAVMANIWSAGLSEYVANKRPMLPAPVKASPINPLNSLEFFEVMNESLRELPLRPDTAALLAQFDAIGIGPNSEFDRKRLSDPRRRGLERALEDGQKIIEAALARSVPEYNGWMSPHTIGRYGYDYVQRASVVGNGYGNLPEESAYAASLVDDHGEMMHGKYRYRLHFDVDQLPPVNAFWSLIPYALPERQMVDNELGRYSIGDRTKGLHYNRDGSLTLWLQHEKPDDTQANWLPVPNQHFIAIMRMYEPKPAVLSREYTLPRVERVE